MTKRQIYDDLLRHDVGAALADARRLLADAMATAEYREGVAALRERRPPQFLTRRAVRRPWNEPGRRTR